MTTVRARSLRFVLRQTRPAAAAAALLASLAGCQSGDTDAVTGDDAEIVQQALTTVDFAGACDDPLVSEDGRSMLVHVCGSLDSGAGTFEQVDLATMRRTKIAEYRGTGRSWSVAGGWFAFSTHEASGLELHLVRVDGTQHRSFAPTDAPELVKRPTEVSEAQISPDGSRVAFKIEGAGEYRYGIFVASLAAPTAMRAPTKFVAGLELHWTSGDTFLAQSGVDHGLFFAKVDGSGNVFAGPSRVPGPLAGAASLVNYPDLAGASTLRGTTGYAIERPPVSVSAPENLLRYDLQTGLATVVDQAPTVWPSSITRTTSGLVYEVRTADNFTEVRRVVDGQAPETLLRVTPPSLPAGEIHFGAEGLEKHFASDDGRLLLLSQPYVMTSAVDVPEGLESRRPKVYLVTPGGNRTFIDAIVDSVDGNRAYIATDGTDLPNLQVDLTTGAVSALLRPAGGHIRFVPSAAGGGHALQHCDIAGPPAPLSENVRPLRLVRYDAAGVGTADVCRQTKLSTWSEHLGSTGAIIVRQSWTGRERFSNPKSFWFRVYRP